MNIISQILLVLRNKKYRTLFIVLTFVLGSILYYLTVADIYHKSLSIYVWLMGWEFAIISLSLGVVTSLLFGLYITLLVYKLQSGHKAKKSGVVGGVGGVSAILATGCVSCSVSIFSVIGLPFVLASLPFDGLELKVLSVFLLLLSIYILMKPSAKDSLCVINQKKIN